MLQFLQDNSGQNSSMRLMVAFVVLAIMVTWIAANVAMAWNAMHGGHLAIVPMDSNMIWALGVALGAKTAQSVVENKQVKP